MELLWSAIQARELAHLAGDHLADVADATERGIHRISQNDQLPWSFLAHAGLTIIVTASALSTASRTSLITFSFGDVVRTGPLAPSSGDRAGLLPSPWSCR
ncbi:hypothetical protein [Streptomyces viridosporus]|uniref:hypothetical protein n=1 Tax=Streptomyces viridosporus TaxID=67581 RepID=UPI0021005F01|nr:hypothetical protein [Streptomyces viridosporus]